MRAGLLRSRNASAFVFALFSPRRLFRFLDLGDFDSLNAAFDGFHVVLTLDGQFIVGSVGHFGCLRIVPSRKE